MPKKRGFFLKRISKYTYHNISLRLWMKYLTTYNNSDCEETMTFTNANQDIQGKHKISKH